MKNTRKEIVNHAIELFKQRGYENTTVLDICKACKITKGTFYYHFPNKDEITFEFYEQIITDFNDCLFDILMLADAKEQLWCVYEFFIDRTIELTPKLLYALLMSDIQRGFDLFTPYGDCLGSTRLSRVRKLQIEIIKKGQSAGQIKMGNPVVMQQVYNAALDSIALAWGRSDGIFDEKEELKKVFDLIF